MRTRLVLLAVAFPLSGCAPSHDQLRQAVADHPDIVLQVAEKHPDRFVAAFERAQARARQLQREEELKHPKAPAVDAGRAIRGDARAPLTIAFYGDFTAPDCARAASTLETVRRRYTQRVKIVYKHHFAENNEPAKLAASWFEAIALQSSEKAFAFHDALLREAEKVAPGGERFLRRAARRARVQSGRLRRDLSSPDIAARLAADREEAARFALSATPSLVVDGVTLAGAPDEEAITALLDRRLKELGASAAPRGVSSVEE